MIKSKLCLALCGLALLATTQVSTAALIPYPTPGTANTATYTFVAAGPGPVTAYFAGTAAAFNSEIAMSINGGPLGTFGLNNHTSPVGTPFLLGTAAAAGDILTFVLRLNSASPPFVVGTLISSDPSANVGYDGGVRPGNQHVYSTPYVAGSVPALGAIPSGTYVAFEDLSANPAVHTSDYNYFDHTFVFENVAVPEPSTYLAGALLALVFGVQGFRSLRSRKQTA